MSKSIGNVIRIKDLIEGDKTQAFRLMVLQSHYRAPLTFTDEGLDAAHRGLDRIRAALNSDSVASDPVALGANIAAETRSVFEQAMDNDFDSPSAMAALFGLARAINRSAGHTSSADHLDEARETLRSLLDVLGIAPFADQADNALAAAPYIDLLLKVREDLRAAKLWKEADSIRAGLSELGITIADGPEGATWRQE